MTEPSLVQPLFDGPLDIVGDTHGEIGALRSLLAHLGYDAAGAHPGGRRLVFLGDLTDRGPDSPAVVDLVRTLVAAGRAQCVLGNHDLNLLLDHRKSENKWFYGEAFLHAGDVIPQKLADDTIRRRVLDFFATLPIALKRDDVRIVHACWDNRMIEIARHADDVTRLYERYRARIDSEAAGRTLDAIDRDLEHQNRNPVKLLSSGPEERADEPVEKDGTMRHERRVLWWQNYADVFCAFGHYSIPAGRPRGNASAFCVDYGIGKRWTERRAGKTNGFSWKLAALRFPEMAVVFDNGGIEGHGT